MVNKNGGPPLQLRFKPTEKHLNQLRPQSGWLKREEDEEKCLLIAGLRPSWPLSHSRPGCSQSGVELWRPIGQSGRCCCTFPLAYLIGRKNNTHRTQKARHQQNTNHKKNTAKHKNKNQSNREPNSSIF